MINLTRGQMNKRFKNDCLKEFYDDYVNGNKKNLPEALTNRAMINNGNNKNTINRIIGIMLSYNPVRFDQDIIQILINHGALINNSDNSNSLSKIS